MALKSEVEYHVQFGPEGTELPYHALLEDFQTQLLSTALMRTNGNKAKAAEQLGMNRTTLVERLKSLGIEWQDGDIVIKGAK